MQTEQQRADLAAPRGPAVRRCPAQPADHAVRGAQPLHLLHRALARRVRIVEPLRDHSVDPGEPAREPALRLRAVARRGREPDARTGEVPRRERLERATAHREGVLGERVPVLVHEQVEREQRRGAFARQLAHATLGRMDAEEQRLELEAALHRHDELAVEHAAAHRERGDRLRDLGEVARERLSRLRLERDVPAVLERDAAEPVPLRLEQPAVALGQRADEARLHRGQRRAKRKVERRPAHRESLHHTMVAPPRQGNAPAAPLLPRIRAAAARETSACPDRGHANTSCDELSRG